MCVKSTVGFLKCHFDKEEKFVLFLGVLFCMNLRVELKLTVQSHCCEQTARRIQANSEKR